MISPQSYHCIWLNMEHLNLISLQGHTHWVKAPDTSRGSYRPKSRTMITMDKSPNYADSQKHGVYHRFLNVYAITIG